MPADPAYEDAARRLAGMIGHGAQGLALARELARAGARTRADLKKPAVLARLPRESQSNVLYNPVRNIPIAVADAVVAEVKRRLVFRMPDGVRLTAIPVGSVRRRAARVKDLDILIIVPPRYEPRIDEVLAAAALRPARAGDRVEFADTYAAGSRKRSFIIRNTLAGGRTQCYRSDFFLTTSAEKPFALFHYTGPVGYNIRTRAHAKRRGLLLNQYGLFDAATGRRVRGTAAIHSERDLAHFLGVTYHPPTARDA